MFDLLTCECVIYMFWGLAAAIGLLIERQNRKEWKSDSLRSQR